MSKLKFKRYTVVVDYILEDGVESFPEMTDPGDVMQYIKDAAHDYNFEVVKEEVIEEERDYSVEGGGE